MRKYLNVGNHFFDIDEIKQQYLQLELFALQGYNYANIEMILGQDMSHVIRSLEYFENDQTNTPIAVRLPLGWVLSGFLSLRGSFLLASELLLRLRTTLNWPTWKLAQKLSWDDMESFGAYIHVDRRSAPDARSQDILEDTTYPDNCRYQVGILWDDDRSTLPINYFFALMQLKSPERLLDKNVELKNQLRPND